jgi:hypothetical protein
MEYNSMIQLKDLDMEMTEILDGNLGQIVGGGGSGSSSSLGSGFSSSSSLSSTIPSNSPKVIMINSPAATPSNTSASWTLTGGASRNGQTNVNTFNLGVNNRYGSGVNGTVSSDGSWSAQGTAGL